MQYERLGELPTPRGASALFENLSCLRTGPKETCFTSVHQSTVSVVSCLDSTPTKVFDSWKVRCAEDCESEKCAGGADQSKHIRGQLLLMQARMYLVDNRKLLVVAASRCVQFFSGESHCLIYSHVLKDSSDSEEAFARGIACSRVSGRSLVFVGTSGGEILTFRVEEQLSRRKLRVLLLTATMSDEHRCAITCVENVRSESEQAGLVSADEQGTVLFWQTKLTEVRKAAESEFSVQLKAFHVASCNDGMPCCVLTAVANDAGKFAICGFADGHVRVYQLCSQSRSDSCALLAELNAHARAVTALDCQLETGKRTAKTTSSTIVLSASEDCYVRVWRLVFASDGGLACSSVEQLAAITVSDALIVGCVFVDHNALQFATIAYDCEQIVLFRALRPPLLK